MMSDENLRVNKKRLVPQPMQNSVPSQHYNQQDQLSAMLSGDNNFVNSYNKYAPIVSSAKSTMWMEAQCGDYAGLRATQANTIFAILDDFSGDYTQFTTPAYSTTTGSGSPVVESSADKSPVPTSSVDEVVDEDAVAEADEADEKEAIKQENLDKLSQIYEKLTDIKEVDNLTLRKRLLADADKIFSDMDPADVEEFKKSDSYQKFEKYLNAEQVYNHKSMYVPEAKEIKEPGRVAAMKIVADKKLEEEHKEQVKNPKPNSRLANLYKTLDHAEAVKNSYKNSQINAVQSAYDESQINALKEDILDITSGKRADAIKKEMDEIEKYFAEYNTKERNELLFGKPKAIKITDKISVISHPILHSKQKRYKELEKELNNLY